MNTRLTYSSCPVTNERTPNGVKEYDGFHISYCRYQAHYGSDTTALVLDGRVIAKRERETTELMRKLNKSGV